MKKVILLIITLLLTSCTSSKYKPFQCAAHIEMPKESWQKPEQDIIKILYVGKNNYGYVYYMKSFSEFGNIVYTMSFSYIDQQYDHLIECSLVKGN